MITNECRQIITKFFKVLDARLETQSFTEYSINTLDLLVLITETWTISYFHFFYFFNAMDI